MYIKLRKLNRLESIYGCITDTMPDIWLVTNATRTAGYPSNKWIPSARNLILNCYIYYRIQNK